MPPYDSMPTWFSSRSKESHDGKSDNDTSDKSRLVRPYNSMPTWFSSKSEESHNAKLDKSRLVRAYASNGWGVIVNNISKNTPAYLLEE